MALPDGGPAFPHDCYYDEKRYDQSEGMSLRDYLAAKALVGLLGYISGDDWESGVLKARIVDVYSQAAYALADAMLKARE